MIWIIKEYNSGYFVFNVVSSLIISIIPDADVSPPEALIDVISHNRSQFAHAEMFTMSCQLPDNSTQWKMLRLAFNSYQNMPRQKQATISVLKFPPKTAEKLE